MNFQIIDTLDMDMDQYYQFFAFASCLSMNIELIQKMKSW